MSAAGPVHAPVLPGRFSQWLDKRIPASARITLSQRNIFIFPTATGFVFAGLLAMLILGAINYQASLVYGVAFLLGSLFLVTILYTFRNLSGLSLEVADARPGFVGEALALSVRVLRPEGHGREGIQLGWSGGARHWAELFEQEADTVRLYVQADRRGWLNPGRLLVETYFPLGLLRAWTWVDLDVHALAYPKPIFQPFPEAAYGRRESGELIDPQGSDDFTDIRAYRPGDPVRHILWRSYARSDEVAVKQYASYQEPRLVFDLGLLDGGLEERLSRLTGLALEASRQEREFAVRLGDRELGPGIGRPHLERVLRELALYGLE